MKSLDTNCGIQRTKKVIRSRNVTFFEYHKVNDIKKTKKSICSIDTSFNLDLIPPPVIDDVIKI